MIKPKFYSHLLFLFLLVLKTAAFAQQKEQALFSFGVISDVQYCDCDTKGTRHYRESLDKLEKAVKVFNKEQVKFVVNLGDFIDRDVASFKPLKNITASLQMPIYHILGNHDFSGSQEGIDEAAKNLGLKHRYYTFKYANYRFIALDGNDISVLGNREGAAKYQLAEQKLEALKKAGANNARPWNGELSTKQFSWFKKQLKKAAKKHEEIIVLCHHPVAPANGGLNLWDAGEIRSQLAQYPQVRAYLNGHAHEGNYAEVNNIPYVTFKGMVEGSENAFSIVDVYPNRLVIKGHGAAPTRTLNYIND